MPTFATSLHICLTIGTLFACLHDFLRSKTLSFFLNSDKLLFFLSFILFYFQSGFWRRIRDIYWRWSPSKRDRFSRIAHCSSLFSLWLCQLRLFNRPTINCSKVWIISAPFAINQSHIIRRGENFFPNRLRRSKSLQQLLNTDTSRAHSQRRVNLRFVSRIFVWFWSWNGFFLEYECL